MRTAYINMAYSWEQRFCSKQQKSHSDWIWTKFGEEKEEIPQTYIHNKSLIEAIELEQMFAIEWFRYFTSFATNFSSFYGHNSVSNSIFSLCVLNIKNNSSHLILLSYICFWNSSGFIAVIVIVVNDRKYWISFNSYVVVVIVIAIIIIIIINITTGVWISLLLLLMLLYLLTSFLFTFYLFLIADL